MKRLASTALFLLAASAASLPPGVASAQSGGDPDLREIEPYLMLVIDTSGSMERLPACACTTPSCEECLPDCALENVSGVPPTSPPPNPRELKKNRWAITLEALTGRFEDFQCERLARTSDNGATYDLGYYLPYHQPWDCTAQAAGTGCATPTAANFQGTNGLLDQYNGRIRFGLMTFDGWDTYVGGLPLIPAAQFDTARSAEVQGLWSYGGAKPFHYPGCDTDYMMDTGARNATATEGSLISMNSCTGGGSPGGSVTCPAWCYSCNGDQAALNRDIQEALLSARPYGGTPIAGSLDDLYYHFKSDLTDAFGGCRNRFALLLTDGYPDADYRDVGCNCANEGDLMNPFRCGGDPSNTRYDPAQMKCPYPKASDAARDLVAGRSGDPPMIKRLFVVGLAVEDQNVLDELNLIARRGCTETNCNNADGNAALFANDLDSVVSKMETIFSGFLHPISRSVPAFSKGVASPLDKQYQISTGFLMPEGPGQPRTGIIERVRFRCADGALQAQNLETGTTSTYGDRFHEVLNRRTAPRVLKTAVPPNQTTGWPDGTDPNGHLFRGQTGAPCEATNGCNEVLLSNTITPETFGLDPTNDARRTEIIEWTHGIGNNARATRRLGDIYHSSPVVMGPPRFDTADEAFNEFRVSTAIRSRPLTMFVGTNDGILHAFSVEAHSTLGIAAGQELWGFIPPILLDDLEDNVGGAHRFSMDATPVVKNVYFNRQPGASGNADQYRSVLITGMREGGNAYIALDVTDPVNPIFLWQFTDPQMGKTFGQAAIGQARYNWPNETPKEGAIAILPGGVGVLGDADGTGTECSDGATNPTMRHSVTQAEFESYRAETGTAVFEHRSDVRCWQSQGRALFFVEVETGRLLKKIYLKSNGERAFPSPLVSTPAIYQADVGTLMTQAYIVDADGVIWRVDMRTIDPEPANALSGWTARPFHDIFFDRGPADGELTYEAPLLSVDEDGRLVVIVGTGDTNNFVKPTIRNRIVSLTEKEDLTPSSAERFRAAVNWEMRVTSATSGVRLIDSELVTGTMALFNGTLFAGTFISVTGGNVCDLGKGRIHALHYRNRDTTQPNGSSGTYAPVLVNEAAVSGTDGSSGIVNVAPDAALDNLMLMGLSLTQRPTCADVSLSDFDVFNNGTNQAIKNIASVVNPSVYIVAQGSGTNSTVSTRAQSQLTSVQLKVNKPSTLSRVVSWATSVD